MARIKIGLFAAVTFAVSAVPAMADRPSYAKMEICNRGEIDVNVLYARESTSLWNKSQSFGWTRLNKGRCQPILDILRHHKILGYGPNQTYTFVLAYISVQGDLPVWLDKNKSEFVYETGLFGWDGGTRRYNETRFVCAPKDLLSRFAIEYSGWKKSDSCGRNNIRVPASNSIWANPHKAYTKATIVIRPKKSNLITFDREQYRGAKGTARDENRPSINPSTGTLEQDIKDLKATVGAIAAFCAMFNCEKGLESIFGGGTTKKKHVYNDGAVYEGDWSNGRPNGLGTMTWPNGTIYTGQWVNGQLHGKVSIASEPDKTVYTGDFRNHKANGWGQIIWGSDSIYEGEFKDGLLHGKGKRVFANGNTYVGDYLNDDRHGQGTLTWSNGDFYTGAWVEGHRHGKGFLRQGDLTYDGNWKASKQHGFGVETYGDGAKFEGFFDQGEISGSGVFTLKTGERCQGQWRENELQGVGIGWDQNGNRMACRAKGKLLFTLQ